MVRYVISGGTGRVGATVARQLLRAGKSVTIVTRSADRAAALKAQGADVSVGTLADARFVARVLDGAVAFFAVLPEPLDVPDFHGERRHMVDAIARGISESAPAHTVVLSSVGAHIAGGMGPISDLHYLEKAILAAGRITTVLRASMFQDNVASAIAPARDAGVFVNLQPDRDTGTPMVAIRDLGAIAATFLSQAPPPQNVVVDVMGPSYSPRQIAAQLGLALGRSIEVVDIPASEHVAQLSRAGFPLPFAQAIAELQGAIASGRIQPVGDRRETGSTTLGQTLNSILNANVEALTA